MRTRISRRVLHAAVMAMAVLLAGSETTVGQVVGPDVTYHNVTSIAHYGPVGGIHAYIFDSHTCNMGDQNLLWGLKANRLRDRLHRDARYRRRLRARFKR